MCNNYSVVPYSVIPCSGFYRVPWSISLLLSGMATQINTWCPSIVLGSLWLVCAIEKQTINFPNSGKFMVSTLEAYGLCVHSKQTISSSCLPYVLCLSSHVCSLAARELGEPSSKKRKVTFTNVQTFLHNGQTNLSLHGHYDCPILVPYIAHCIPARGQVSSLVEVLEWRH